MYARRASTRDAGLDYVLTEPTLRRGLIVGFLQPCARPISEARRDGLPFAYDFAWVRVGHNLDHRSRALLRTRAGKSSERVSVVIFPWKALGAPTSVCHCPGEGPDLRAGRGCLALGSRPVPYPSLALPPDSSVPLSTSANGTSGCHVPASLSESVSTGSVIERRGPPRRLWTRAGASDASSSPFFASRFRVHVRAGRLPSGRL